MAGIWTLIALALTAGPVGAAAAPPNKPGAAPPATIAPPGTTTKPSATTAPSADAGPVFRVSRFILTYWKPHPQQPPLDQVSRLELVLGKTPDGYTAASPQTPSVRIPLGKPLPAPAAFTASAIRSVAEQVVQCYKDQFGLTAIFVTQSADDIDPRNLKDKRQGRTDLTLVIWIGAVTQARTVSFGDRFPADQRINNPALKRIVENSPVQPVAPGRENNLVRENDVDDYVFRLNRHPGRRVDVATASAGQPGQVALDYLVTQNKPWLAYFQLSNTGTRNTQQWRERFGFIHTQLTNNDDILTVDYTTAGFEQAHAAMMAYEAPFFRSQWLRWRVYASWSEYTASDVGIDNLDFTGHDWRIGAEAIWNFYQHRAFFLDLVGGMYGWHVGVNNKTFRIEGEDCFLVPYVGVRAQQRTDKDNLWAEVMMESNASGLADTDRNQLDRLGRPDLSRQWVVMKVDTGMSFYLEPLLERGLWPGVTVRQTVAQPEAARLGVREKPPWTAETQNQAQRQQSTLAHEIATFLRGQWSGGYRLIPQNEGIVGGLYTVRGYPESATAGDSVMIGSAEYRYHIPRAFKIQADPTRTPLLGQPFRFSPQENFGLTDWDLIAKSFFDMGRAFQTDSQAGEANYTLVSWGVGLELQIRQNISVRADWGIALRDLEGTNVDAGDSRLHFVLTVMW